MAIGKKPHKYYDTNSLRPEDQLRIKSCTVIKKTHGSWCHPLYVLLGPHVLGATLRVVVVHKAWLQKIANSRPKK